MKAKYDFITNSSSASFIMYIRLVKGYFNEDNLLEEFKKEFQCFINNRNPKITRFFTDIIAIEEWTPMYNGSEEIPEYMMDLMIDRCTIGNPLPKYIIDIKFEIREH